MRLLGLYKERRDFAPYGGESAAMKSDEIDLQAYVRIVKRRIGWIALFVAACTLAAGYYSYANYVPLYQASTKLIVNDSQETDPFGRQMMNLGALGSNSGAIDTYKEIIRTPLIMDKVAAQFPNLGVSADHLMNIVNVYDLNNTQVMTITATDVSHERAVMIVNAITDVFQAELPSISGASGVVVLTRAEFQELPQPINEKQNTYVVLGFLASLVVSVGWFVVLDSMDDSIKTEDDVREAFGVPTLAEIPKLKRRGLRASSSAGASKATGGGSYAAYKS